MATYKEIQVYVREKYGFVPETCWIAHVKELCGLKMRPAHNRMSRTRRKRPCPAHRSPPIIEALRHFGLVRSYDITQW